MRGLTLIDEALIAQNANWPMTFSRDLRSTCVAARHFLDYSVDAPQNVIFCLLAFWPFGLFAFWPTDSEHLQVADRWAEQDGAKFANHQQSLAITGMLNIMA